METKLDRQLRIEKEAHDYSYDRLTREIGKRIEQKQSDELSEGKTILIHSIDKLSKKIKEYFEASLYGKQKQVRDLVIGDFNESPRDLALVLLVTIVRSVSKDVKIPTTSLIRRINSSIYEAILVNRLDNQDNNLSSYVDKRYKTRSRKFRHLEKLKIMKRADELNNPDLTSYTAMLGGTMLDLILKSGINIIEKKIIYSKGKKVQYILYTEECFRMILESRSRLLDEYRKFPILIMKPKDWEDFDGSGGYHNGDLYKVPLIKARSTSKKLLREFLAKTDNEKLYKTLNTLQATPWQVNQRVFDVMNQVFEENIIDEACADNNPYLLGKLPYNGNLEPEDFLNIYSYGEIQTEGCYKGLPKDPKMMRKWFKDKEAQQDIINSNIGKAIMMNLVLSNAKEYLNEDEIYFSYQYDFRGRIYPIQQHLQPQGKSEVKALLQFKNGHRIESDEQLWWFCIHGANCYGYDKESYEERVKRIREKEEEIKLIADDPFKYREYWKDADEPYLYLAWCFEYSEYLANPSYFRSHIPIALDATCSGIQIYSGLLRDKDGAEAVNVIGDVRNDIYQRVADKVNEYLLNGDYPKDITYKTKDGKEHKADTKALVDSIKGKITRKLTKRNTMTQPYSVTKYGMYEQLKDELQSIENDNKKFWVGDIWVLAKLLTDLNDRAIAEVVKGARVGQEYLKEVTDDLVKQGGYVFYTTPITRFPVLQKIHKTKVDRVVTPIGRLSVRTAVSQLHLQKMVNGIAPNFVHSLDATLLAYTVLKLADSGCVDFHLIHDSYGVPISYIPALNKSVREAFVELFKEEPLQQFINQVHPTYYKTVDEVMINDLDLDEVLESEYIFS